MAKNTVHAMDTDSENNPPRLLFPERMLLRLQEGTLDLIKGKATEAGQTQSEYVRQIIHKDLRAGGKDANTQAAA